MKLYIAGAGGFGREVLAWVRQSPSWEREWSFSGFLDDDPKALDDYPHLGPPAGTIHAYSPGADDAVLVAVGDPRLRLGVVENLRARGARFASLVHPTAVVGDNVHLGEGVILCPHACLTADVVVGSFVHLNVAASLGHDVKVGECTTISAHADVTGHARIGRGVFLGSHAVVLPRVEVEDFARVGAGAVVLRRVKAGTSVFGSPARTIRDAG